MKNIDYSEFPSRAGRTVGWRKTAGLVIGGWALMALMALMLVPSHAAAQLFVDDEISIPKVLASFESKLEPAKARPGEHIRLIITVQVAEGWYTYSVVPQGEFAPPPTKLTLEPGPLQLEGPFYETNPTVKKDKVFNLPLAFHTKAARFYQNLKIPEETPPGEIVVEGAIRYQVCNNRLCTPPRNEGIKVGLTIESGDVRPAYGYVQRTIDFLDADGNFEISADTLEGALSQGLVTFLLLAAGFGLLALLTPCVFPMLPITVAFFTGESQRGGRSVVKLAVLFAAGIVLTYTGLGLALTFFLGAAGVGQFAYNPWVNLFVALFFVLFALSLMGALQFALPSGMVQNLDSASRKFKGPVGVLLMGVAFTATSFTCTMPFVGTLLISATQGEFLWPLVGMLTFSTVFAMPFFLLALFPKFLVNVRGKSGNWLVQLKVVLGLVELAAALKFLSNADLIWQWGLISRELMLGFWAVIAVVTALILLGLLPWPGVDRVHLAKPRLAVGAAFLAIAVYMGAGLAGRELDSYTEAYMPPDITTGTVVGQPEGDFLDPQAVHDLAWWKSLDEGLTLGIKEGKPIFIDFTGYTCINCRWMEKNIFAERSVFEALRDEFVLVQLYTDGGDNAEVNQKLQIERFRTIALPYYVILSPDNAVLAKHAGIMTKPADFLTWLNRGQQLYAQMTQEGECQLASQEPPNVGSSC